MVSRGFPLPAGLGVSVVTPTLDFETYSEAGFAWNVDTQRWSELPGASSQNRGLSTVGAEPYVRHPSFRILCAAYDLYDGQGSRHWRPELPPPADLFAYLATGGTIEAWNVGFERWVWELHCVSRLGWPAVASHQWRCAMAKARAYCLPGKLAETGRVLGLETQKDAAGSALLKVFSVPRNPTKTDPRLAVLPMWTHPGHPPGARKAERDRIDREFEQTQQLADYNLVDIEAEASASHVVPDIEGEELAWWQADQAINRRGVHMDRVGVENCIAIIEQAHARYNTELLTLTGIDAASKVQQLQGWLHGRGVHLDSLDEEAVSAALTRNDLDPVVRRVLEIRAAVGSASVKKAFAIRNRLSSDDRLRDLFIYHGARTGRATGEGPQPTNLPKAGPPVQRCAGCKRHFALASLECPYCRRSVLPARPVEVEWNPDAAEDALFVIGTKRLDTVEYVFGDAMAAVSGALRALFMAAPGHDLISTDYNSIEAVGLAMLAGEQWRIDVFRTHGKIYETSAAMMYRLDLDDVLTYKQRNGQHHPLRQKGKIAELAFGYQGWLGAAQAFGMPGSENEIKNDILAWRRASPSIEWLWGGQTLGKAAAINTEIPTDRWDATPYYFGAEGAAISAVLAPGQWFRVKRMNGTDSGIGYLCQNNTLFCELPSGRRLVYHRPRLSASPRGGYALSFEGWNSNPKNGPMGWITMNTWGGRLVENFNQATCREILRYAVLNLEAHAYPVVLHVYDEIASEIPEGFGSTSEYERLVEQRPPFAKDWPIRAPGAWRAKRYRKA
jgi:DNA polymerase